MCSALAASIVNALTFLLILLMTNSELLAISERLKNQAIVIGESPLVIEHVAVASSPAFRDSSPNVKGAIWGKTGNKGIFQMWKKNRKF
jgi:hypothetical protein